VERYKYIIRFFIIAAIISALVFAFGCKPAISSSEVEELKEKIAELEEKLTESAGESAIETGGDEELAGDKEVETETAKESAESAEEETRGSGVEALRDKVCLVDTGLNDFTKLQTLCYQYGLNLIKEFEAGAYNTISLATLLNPNDARLTKLYDYTNKGGTAVCYYYKEHTKYNDTLKQLFNVSLAEEDVFKENTSSVTLDGGLFSDFTNGLKIAFIKDSTNSMRISAYINDIDKSSIWHSEYTSSTTSKENYFALIKNIGNGQILFIPHLTHITPFEDKQYDNMDNAVFIENIIKWSLK